VAGRPFQNCYCVLAFTNVLLTFLFFRRVVIVPYLKARDLSLLQSIHRLWGPPLYSVGTGALSRGYSGRGVKPSALPHVVPRLSLRAPPPPPSWQGQRQLSFTCLKSLILPKPDRRQRRSQTKGVPKGVNPDI